jgi:microcystin degradation protein MlrC
MKVLLAQFIFESNTFNEAPAELGLFTRGGTWLTEEGAVRAWCATADSQLAGSLAVLETAGCETHPVFVANCGTPAGRLSAECFQTIKTTLGESLRAAGPAEAMLLHLHGSACAVGEDDTEGNILEHVRRELGFSGRLIVSLDLHANVTRRMLTHADAITAYRTMPHLDFRETGERAARLVLMGHLKMRRVLAKLAALIPPTDTHHASGRFAEILTEARRIEAQPGVFDVSVFPVQPWMDVEEMGSSVVITASPESDVQSAAADLARRWYDQRRFWQTGIRPWDKIIETLRQPPRHPWMLVDSADATTAGSSGGSAEAIVRLWPWRDRLPGDVLLWVVDAAACAAFQSGEPTCWLGEPRLEISGQVIFSGEGRYRARGRAYTGQAFSMGQTVVVSAGRLRIVVSSAGALGADPAFYECLGLEPDRALAVQVKSLMGWRAGYAAPAEWGLVFDGPGSASLNFSRLPFTGVRRDLFPVNDSPAHPFYLWQSN